MPPGVPFTEKPFAEIIRADLKQVLVAKATPTLRSYKKKGSERRSSRERSAARRPPTGSTLGYARCGTGRSRSNTRRRRRSSARGKARTALKHDEFGRDRRLRKGEEAGLLAGANQHLKEEEPRRIRSGPHGALC